MSTGLDLHPLAPKNLPENGKPSNAELFPPVIWLGCLFLGDKWRQIASSTSASTRDHLLSFFGEADEKQNKMAIPELQPEMGKCEGVKSPRHVVNAHPL